jgi:hypothetical protein
MKINAIEKMNIRVLSTPAAIFDAPVNIFPVSFYLK